MLLNYARIAVSSFTLSSMDREDCMQHAILKVLEENKQNETRSYIVTRMRLRIYDWLRKQRNYCSIEDITPLYYKEYYSIIEKIPEDSTHYAIISALLATGSLDETAKCLGVHKSVIYKKFAQLRRILRD